MERKTGFAIFNLQSSSCRIAMCNSTLLYAGHLLRLLGIYLECKSSFYVYASLPPTSDKGLGFLTALSCSFLILSFRSLVILLSENDLSFVVVLV